ncbi:MAG: hypothetical protein AAB575_04195 [Patescibacteria group bacterium]
METFMTILFILALIVMLVGVANVIWAIVVALDMRELGWPNIIVSLIGIAVALGGYIAAVNIDDYQAEMKVEQFRTVCVLTDGDNRFDAARGTAVFKFDGDIEVEMVGGDWTIRLDDQMYDAAKLPNCKKK